MLSSPEKSLYLAVLIVIHDAMIYNRATCMTIHDIRQRIVFAHIDLEPLLNELKRLGVISYDNCISLTDKGIKIVEMLRWGKRFSS